MTESPGSAPATRGKVEDWLALDARRALDQHERTALAASRAARTWVLELVQGGHWGELPLAFAQLGRALARERVSPATALGTLDSGAHVLAGYAIPVAHWEAASAALREAYVASRLDAVRSEERARFSRSWVRVDEEHAAVTAFVPDDDAEWIQAWSDAVASELLRARVRRVTAWGSPDALGALRSALDLVGIPCHDVPQGSTGAPPARDPGAGMLGRWRRLWR